MKKNIKRLPNQPFYLSDSEVVNIEWANNFASHIEEMGGRFGVPNDLISKILANNLVLQSYAAYKALLDDWQEKWRDTKNSLMYLPSGNTPIALPAIPEHLPEIPPAVEANIFGPFIQAATFILVSDKLTEADKNTLGLVKAKGKPVPPTQKKRKKVSQHSFPVLKATVKNGVVTIQIIRGDRFRGKSILLKVDRLGKGSFETLLNTTGKTVTDKIVLPEDVATTTWTYKGIYMEGHTQMSEWSPNVYVTVTNEPTVLQPVLELDREKLAGSFLQPA